VKKKIVLAVIAFLLAGGAFVVLSSGDRTHRPGDKEENTDALKRFVSLPPTTQPGRMIQDGDIPFSPGDHTLARVYDDISGRLKYQFEAKTWEPVSETDFHLRDMLIQIFMPHGEITYISADEAQVTLARRSRNRVDPKNGWVRGNVKVTIDRTTAEWREANPELAERYAHPNDLINIDLQDAKFDMERAELTTEGPILVDSADVRVEDVSGLVLQWDQVDNRIDVLRFKQGGKMTLRRGGRMVDFALPGTQRDRTAATTPPAGSVSANEMVAAQNASGIPRALAMKPMSIPTVSADQAAAQIRLEGGAVSANKGKTLDGRSSSASAGEKGKLRTPEALVEASQALKNEVKAGTSGVPLDPKILEELAGKKRKKVDTYRAAFEGSVVIEQKDGLRTVGKLEADKLELNFDFGESQKSLTGSRRRDKAAAPAVPTATAPASDAPETPARPAEARPADDQNMAVVMERDRTKLVLAWNGPLEMRPLQPDVAEQTGQRFDAIATGAPVRVESEQGRAACNQLVYRHERRQVWLAGSDEQPVELAVSAARKLTGREVFFDQKRGLALVDGAGLMVDTREQGDRDGAAAADSLLSSLSGGSEGEGKPGRKRRNPVQITWSRGVDLELGFRPVERINPSTGLKEEKQKEFLQRAWFHGDVSIEQGQEKIGAQEIAVTFGPPSTKDDVADHIQHLNMMGDVRLQRGKESITAERLDAEMIVTANKRNVPRIVDAEGAVEVKQGDREIRAGAMHVVLAEVQKPKDRPASGQLPAFGDSRLGVESLDAHGDVFVVDPRYNLRIHKTDSLQCRMDDAGQLVEAVVTGQAPDEYARVRYGDTAIHGHLVKIAMEDESVDVPGPGKAWMMSRQDFTGRKLRNPEPVKVTWTDSMQFRLARNVGHFIGKVHSEAQSFVLDCDKLVIRFAKVPPERETRKEGVVERWHLLGEIIGDKASVKEQAPTPLSRERKRPIYVSAEGNAQAMSCQYAPPAVTGETGRLLSRLWISGDKIVADLGREQLSVPCQGGLLIEDYQFEPQSPRVSAAKAKAAGGPLMGTMRSEGPSQTAVTWENSMDFFLDRGLVTFDKNVSMLHRSGQEMVMQDKLSEAMKINQAMLEHLSRGRKASLSCGNLLLEFATRRQDEASDSAAPPIRATDLNRMIAKQAVHLQEDTKSLMGEYLQYLNESNEVRLEGSASLEARIIDQDERDQRLTMWRGPLLVWDRRTNRIEAPGAAIRASRR
jgi:lipopolysaccharide export system protein LptA